MTILTHRIVTVLAWILIPTIAGADMVSTRDGAQLVGTIKGIENGKITLETSYAGTLEIDTAEVVTFETQDPVFVRLDSGNTMSGQVKARADGEMQIINDDGTMSTTMDRVVMSWNVGDKDPLIAAEENLRRKWSYSLSGNVAGKTGNVEENSFGLRGSATLKGPDDTLLFYGSYFTAEVEGVKTDDETVGGVRYESFVVGDLGWYVRAEGEKDEFENLDFRATAGGGATYRFINQDNHNLTGRVGTAYRHQTFLDSISEDDLTLDFGLSHKYTHNDYWSVATELNFNPATSDFGNFLINHVTDFEIPLPSKWWSLGLGISNKYNSEPAVGFESWDMRYYASLILNFD